MSGQTVVVSVLADTKRFARGMDDAGGGVTGLIGKLGPLAGVVAGAFSIGAVVQFTKRLTDSASQLQQSVGGVSAVFKENAAEINAWAKGAGSAVGLTKQEYNAAATSIGTYLKSAGIPMDELGGKTNDLVARGADLAAMFGGSTQEAVNAMGSALRGEFEPLRRYGVALSAAEIQARALAMTGKTNAAQLTASEKSLATQALIYERSADAAGQFARESNTLAGQQERLRAGAGNLSATLGGVLLPIATGLTGVMAGLLGKVTESEAFNAAIATATAFAESLFTGESAAGGFLAQLLPLLQFFSPLGLVLKALGPVLPLLGQGLAEIGTVLAATLLPLLPQLTEILQSVVGVISSGLATVLPALIPIILAVAQAFGGGLVAILPALLTIITALVPIIAQLAEFVGQVAIAFGPVIAQVATLAGQLLEAFMPILLAVLPPLLELTGILLEYLLPVLEFLIGVILAVVTGIVDFISWIVELATTSSSFTEFMQRLGQGFLDFFGAIPGQIGAVFAGVGQWLVDAGGDLIQGFIDGIQGMIGAVGDAVGGVLDFVAGFFPHSPAKRGPFAGRGWTELKRSGLAIAEQFGDGLGSYSFDGMLGGLAAQLNGGLGVELAAPAGYRNSLGGNTYEITVQAIAPNAEVGRVVVQAIDDYESLNGGTPRD